MRRALTACLTGLAGLAIFGSMPASPVAAITHHPRIPEARGSGGSAAALGWASSNWSGYAVTGGTGAYHAITGAWSVPSVAPSRGATYSSNWIGIDGFNNSQLIQTGTEQDYSNGSTHYYAWWEILPAAETVIPSIPVSAGDAMTASITQGSGGVWTITIADTTTGKSFTTAQSYKGPGTSAEWIEEAPSIGRVTTLANYGTTTFDPGTVNGLSPGLVAADGGAMIQHRVQVSTPSTPDSDADGFSAKYGSAAPAPPGS